MLDTIMSYKTIFSNKKNRKASGGSDSILANMFVNIMTDTGINFEKWDSLVNRYIRDPRNSIPNNDRDRSSERGNLRKELLKDKMTWKVFCKGMRLLNFPRFDLTLTIYHNDIKKTVSDHTLKINLGEAIFDDDIEQTAEEQAEQSDKEEMNKQ